MSPVVALFEGAGTTITTSIENLATTLTSSMANMDFSLLLSPLVAVFPTVFTIMLAIAGVHKAIGFVRSILGC